MPHFPARLKVKITVAAAEFPGPKLGPTTTQEAKVQNVLYMSPEARAAFDAARVTARDELEGLPAHHVQAFMMRLERYWQDLFDGLKPPYGAREDFASLLTRLVRLLSARFAERPEDLKALDLERNLTPDWFQSERRIGYVFYADRFAGDLAGVAEKLDYLEEIGASYVHIMPLLASRPAVRRLPDCGGLGAVRRGQGMSPCLELDHHLCARQP